VAFDKSKFISPILCGGFGNNLFQVATAIHHHNVTGHPFIIGYWTSSQSQSRLPVDHVSHDAGKHNPYFQPWGGWSGTNYSDFTWPFMFPQLPYFDNPNNIEDGYFNTTNEDAKWAYQYDTGSGGEYIPLDVKPGTQFQGYFFNHKYWHESRDLIKFYLGFGHDYHELGITYVPHYLKAMTTVSLNIRLPDLDYAGDMELKDDLLKDLEDWDWIERAMNYFPDNTLFLVTSNDSYRAKNIMKEKFPDKKLYFAVGSPGYQMLLSTQCAHHIVTCSTFSFWCAYLDPKQPMGHTIYSPSFPKRHSKNCIPYDIWVQLD
tara:strand:- start:528 stop:1478 length:951 start_codon:yes stop_codon:yes gene_type:complete